MRFQCLVGYSLFGVYGRLGKYIWSSLGWRAWRLCMRMSLGDWVSQGDLKVRVNEGGLSGRTGTRSVCGDGTVIDDPSTLG